jgi:ribosome biogenesis GTPase
MAKRRLTQQQQRRIAKNKTDQLDIPTTTDDKTAQLKGIVVNHYGRQVVVETAEHEQHTCKIRQNLGDIACGDRVAFHPQEDTGNGVVVAIEPRDNLLEKIGFGNKAKPVAANVGQVVIICAVEPAPNIYLIDRYLVAIENLNAQATLVLNKIDLTNETDQDIIDSIDNYRQLGYSVIHTCAVDERGIDELRAKLKNTTSIFVGLSGVGKTSLVNRLIPETDARVAEVSENTGEGRHTTTVSSLYHLPDGGELIDSPGVRDFTPHINSKAEVFYGFVEIRNIPGKCKFANCSHQHEPGCAILQAVAEGKISKTRYGSYQHMLSDLENS